MCKNTHIFLNTMFKIVMEKKYRRELNTSQIPRHMLFSMVKP
jgi:hypothetical protein